MPQSSKTNKNTKKTVKKSRSKSAPKLKQDGYFSNDLSFKVVKDPLNFMTMKFTQQTMIWTILLTFIMFIQIWILSMQLTAIDALNSIK